MRRLRRGLAAGLEVVGFLAAVVALALGKVVLAFSNVPLKSDRQLVVRVSGKIVLVLGAARLRASQLLQALDRRIDGLREP